MSLISCKNPSGYPDPTAFAALEPIAQADARLERRARNLVRVVRYVVREAGFQLEGRIEIRDEKTGRVFR